MSRWRLEPILGYISKIDGKKDSGHKGWKLEVVNWLFMVYSRYILFHMLFFSKSF